jgi:GrpB-like predicted nucleotidyltransferase (UPF0157 family)
MSEGQSPHSLAKERREGRGDLGGIIRRNAPIVLEEYDPRWPAEFERLCKKIAGVLSESAVAIEHVGSTAVPGLTAKAIIDLDVLLRSGDALAVAIERLTAIGYQHQGDLGVPGREAFRAPSGAFPHHLCVCLPDRQEYARHIAFRDYLRRNPELARAYARLKRELAGKFAHDRDAYTRGKSEFVEEILRRAGPLRSFASEDRRR